MRIHRKSGNQKNCFPVARIVAKELGVWGAFWAPQWGSGAKPRKILAFRCTWNARKTHFWHLLRRDRQITDDVNTLGQQPKTCLPSVSHQPHENHNLKLQLINKRNRWCLNLELFLFTLSDIIHMCGVRWIRFASLPVRQSASHDVRKHVFWIYFFTLRKHYNTTPNNVSPS